MSEGTTVKRNVTVVVLVLTITVAFFAFRHKRVNITGSPARKGTSLLVHLFNCNIHVVFSACGPLSKITYFWCILKISCKFMEHQTVY